MTRRLQPSISIPTSWHCERNTSAAESPVAQSIFGLTLLAGLYAAVSPWVIGSTQQGVQ
jgi:hypothetical protein